LQGTVAVEMRDAAKRRTMWSVLQGRQAV